MNTIEVAGATVTFVHLDALENAEKHQGTTAHAKEGIMAKVPAFHSTESGVDCYHNNDQCTEGNNIEPDYLAQGTGGYRLCDHYRRENEKEAQRSHR